MMQDSARCNELLGIARELLRDDIADPIVWLGEAQAWLGDARELLEREVLHPSQSRNLSQRVAEVEERLRRVVAKGKVKVA